MTRTEEPLLFTMPSDQYVFDCAEVLLQTGYRLLRRLDQLGLKDDPRYEIEMRAFQAAQGVPARAWLRRRTGWS